ncbi:MAG: hypothetical protein E7333_00845 [Clostridiales bacterium]|nr:hypothetical protein [Clostridiales bacterium]
MATPFTNQATISYRNCLAASNVVSGILQDELTMTKTAISEGYQSCCGITYAVSIVNSGQTVYTGLTLTDDLGAYTLAGGTSVTPLTYADGSVVMYQNGVLTTVPTVAGEDPLTLTSITVPAGGNVLILYRATPNQYAPLGTDAVITNTAALTGAGVDNVTASATTNAATGPSLTILKAVDPAVVTPDDTVTYTFTIQNYGPEATVATDNVVLTDVFDLILTLTDVTLDGAALISGLDYTYDEATGEFTTTIGTITVPAAAYTQNATTGEWTVIPGVTTLVVTGTV